MGQMRIKNKYVFVKQTRDFLFPYFKKKNPPVPNT